MGRINVTPSIFAGASAPNWEHSPKRPSPSITGSSVLFNVRQLFFAFFNCSSTFLQLFFNYSSKFLQLFFNMLKMLKVLLVSFVFCASKIPRNPHWRQPKSMHTFSAFWLWSSVVSVLISVTTDMSPTGDLLVTWMFQRGVVVLSLLRHTQVLHWHGTTPGAAHPSG